METKNKISPITIAIIILSISAIVGLIRLSHIGWSWAIVAGLGIYALSQVWRQGTIWWRGRHNKVAAKERFLCFLASLMGLFLVSGTALYLWAFYNENVDSMHDPKDGYFLFVNAEYLLRSIVCSLNLFMLNIDSNVLDGVKEHYYLKGLISIQAVLSFSCTVGLLISLVYARVKAFFILHKRTTIDKDHNHLYVFFGLNEPSKLLAKSIREREGERALIVIVEKSTIDDEDRGGWNSIVGMFTHKRQTFAEADELNARITFTETKICEVDKDNLSNFDILGGLNLQILRILIQRLPFVEEAELHVFFLSDNEDENIRSMSMLAKDETVNACVGKLKQSFYCHARRSGLNKVIEDVAVKRGLEVNIIDSAHLSIELLKANEHNHPVRLMDVDKDNPTTVKSKFTSLIIGFDEAGQDALRFLYEFGAFVDSHATPQNEKRSPFSCIVVDNNMEQLKGYFYAFAPTVREKEMPENVNIVFRENDCQSEDFYKLFSDEFKNDLNYVVIAVGSDELGMTCAIRVFNYVRQCREDLSKFRIYVRSYNTEKEDYMQQIASHYNEGYNHDRKEGLKNEEKEKYIPQTIIIPFGQKKQIYSYEMIIDKKIITEGQRFMEGYAKMKHGEELWEDRRQFYLGYKEKTIDIFGNKIIREIPIDKRELSLNNIRSLRRKESQDIANAQHAGTKLYLLNQAFGKDYDWQDFILRYFDADGKTPHCEGKREKRTYPCLSPQENLAILNLARLEHIRWIASHEMLGYQKVEDGSHKCDERKRVHNCLRPWNELDQESLEVTENEGWDADYKSFDFAVVDISLLLYKDKLTRPSLDKE